MTNGKRYDRAKVLALYGQGLSYPAIARRLGMQPSGTGAQKIILEERRAGNALAAPRHKKSPGD